MALTRDTRSLPYTFYSTLFCITMLIAAAMPFFLVRDPILQVNDNLDGTNLVLLHILKSYGLLFSFDGEVPMLHGLSRLYFPAELKLWGFLFAFFDDFLVAYRINFLLKLAIGYFGMWAFLKTVIAKGQGTPPLQQIVALCFALLPCQPENSIPFASLPLAFLLFHRLYTRSGRSSALLVCIALYPLLSDFSRFGLYIIGALGLFAVYDTLARKRLHVPFAAGIVLLTLGYVVTEYRLFYNLLYLGAETVRKEFQLNRRSYFDMDYVVAQFFKLLTDGQYHFAETVHKYLLLPSVVLFLAVTNMGKRHRNPLANRLFAAFAFIMAVKFIYMAVVQVYLADHIPLFRVVQADRLYIFMPILLYSLFYMAAAFFYEHVNKMLALALASAQALFIFFTPALYNESLRNIQYEKYAQEELSFSEFYSQPLFAKIKKQIGYSGEWSLAVGLHPSILLYNSIHTLDGYHNHYPLAYKHAFREIIAPELRQNNASREYFDYWGCRAYAFNEEFSKNVRDKMTKAVTLNIDPAAFTRMGGKFVFSRAAIANSPQLDLKFMGEFTDPSSPYTIYVYENMGGDNAGLLNPPQ